MYTFVQAGYICHFFRFASLPSFPYAYLSELKSTPILQRQRGAIIGDDVTLRGVQITTGVTIYKHHLVWAIMCSALLQAVSPLHPSPPSHLFSLLSSNVYVFFDVGSEGWRWNNNSPLMEDSFTDSQQSLHQGFLLFFVSFFFFSSFLASYSSFTLPLPFSPSLPVF